MAKRGPPKTPTHILDMQGSRHADRSGEPEPDSGAPPCPDWLSKEVRAVWRQVIKHLDTLGVLAKSDGNAIARYCCLWVRWKKAELFIEGNGESYETETKSGGTYYAQYPEVATVNKLSIELRRLEQEFGLTPSARAGIQLDLTPSNTPGVIRRDRTA